MTEDAAFWILDNPDPDTNMTNPTWVALVSEADEGIIAVGRADVMEACAEALNTTPDDWEAA